VKTVKAEKNKKGTVYYFKGDRWGNYEAVAYFEEKKSINSIVLHCSNEKDFRVSIKSFEDLVKSYKPLSLKR
jgi:hypothetical protein